MCYINRLFWTWLYYGNDCSVLNDLIMVNLYFYAWISCYFYLPFLVTGRSARSIASSLKSAEILLPDEKVFSQYDEAIADIDTDLENVQTVMGVQKSVEIPTAGVEGRKSGALSEAVSSHYLLNDLC